jgi:hypothetical protein
MNVIDHNDVHFVCILTDDEVEITSYLFDVRFALNSNSTKNLHSLQQLLALRAIYREKKSNPFCILCAASITGGVINLNMYSSKRNHFDILQI